MGSGQSKFFRNRNYDHQTQYPYGPPSGYSYPPPAGFIPNYGYPTGPMFPQPQPQHGFVPPSNYGQGRFLPPPQLNWLPQDKQRKKRKSGRTQSDQFVGFQPGATSGGQPQPQQQQESRSRRPRSESRRRNDPEPPPTQRSTSQSGTRRAATPFIPPASREIDDDDDVDQPRAPAATSESNRLPSRHAVPIHYPTPPPIRAEFANVIEPLEPASASAFGPTGRRPRTPLSNPLPAPPRDLYEMTPYKSLLTLPQTTALLTATYGPHTAGTHLGVQPSVQRKKTSKGGLFRAFSKRERRDPDPGPQGTQFIPVFVPSKVGEAQPSTQAAVANLIRSQSQQSRLATHPPIPTTPNTGGLRSGEAPSRSPHTPSSPESSSESIPPVPPVPTVPPTIHFNQTSVLNPFLTHSPHRILHEGKIYPSALHLHEALKFLEHRPDIAEAIRNCALADVYPLSAKFQAHVRPDWNSRFLEFMLEVLRLKFTQHPDLRSTLLSTGAAQIIYDDPTDPFWGSGPDGQGQNELGQLLTHIRQSLRAETVGFTPP